MLQTDGRYTKREIINSINSLKKIIATSYDPRLLRRVSLTIKTLKVIGKLITFSEIKIFSY